jgi:uncharacterized membrane protein
MSYPPDLPPAPGTPYNDRRTGLTVFGILTLLMGVVCALLVPLMLATLTIAPRPGVPAQDTRTMLPAILMYGGLAVMFIWLGIGSIMARRWARALLLIISWCWLLIGIVSTVVMVTVVPGILEKTQTALPPGQPAPPPEVMQGVMGFTFVFLGVLFVILPAVWVFFYGSRHVKATCEAADPVERWTDRCPLPVLAIPLWLLSSLPWFLVMAVSRKAVIPFFGMFVAGPPAAAGYLLLTVLWGYGAWAIYKLRPTGWWIVTISMVVFCISAFLTYSRHDISELYRLMNYPADQITLMEKFNFLTGTRMAWLTLATIVPVLGYLLFVKRYFRALPAQ